MARLNVTFTKFVTVCVLAAHLVLLPALYFGVSYIIRRSHEDWFIQHAKTFARVIAGEFAVGSALDSAAMTSDLLDIAIIHGEGVFAELADGVHSVRSSLGAPEIKAATSTDFRYAQSRDGIYFVVLPIQRAGTSAELRLGFDERPTTERIQLALNRLLLLMGVYLSIAIVAALYLSNRLSRPIRRLQDVSHAIASGNYARALNVSTGIRELDNLAEDLEATRRELVGVNDRLEQKIRAHELADTRRGALEKQLRHRQRVESVGTLAGGIAHEVNNLLVPIILFTETAMQDLPPQSRSHNDLVQVLASARRAKNVVQKILRFSHIGGDTALAPTELRSVVTESRALFAALVPPTIDVRTDFAAEIPMVRADATLLSAVVMNLCTNALQSMQGGRGVLTLALRWSAPYVELSVADTGHGMDPATMQRIFEPFFTTRPVGQGSGLGLSVVHDIVESFGARITVESTPGRGTTFRIFFPADSASSPTESAVRFN